MGPTTGHEVFGPDLGDLGAHDGLSPILDGERDGSRVDHPNPRIGPRGHHFFPRCKCKSRNKLATRQTDAEQPHHQDGQKAAGTAAGGQGDAQTHPKKLDI
jgi:hypothetical protein